MHANLEFVPESLLGLARETFCPTATSLPMKSRVEPLSRRHPSLLLKPSPPSQDPTGVDDIVHSMLSNYAFMEHYRTFSFVLLHHELLKEIAEICLCFGIKTVIEVGAGLGWLSWWMQRYGLEVVDVSDSRSWGDFDFTKAPRPVRVAEAELAVRDCPADLVVLSWPLPDDPMAYDTWNAMKSGQFMLFCGEMTPATGDEQFQQLVPQHTIATLEHYLSFWGMKDRGFLMRKP